MSEEESISGLQRRRGRWNPGRKSTELSFLELKLRGSLNGDLKIPNVCHEDGKGDQDSA